MFNREECANFQLEEPNFKQLDEVSQDISRIQTIWGIYEEFQNGMKEFTKEDWVSFRSKTYKFEEFLQAWQDRLKQEIAKGKPSTMQSKIQKDIDLLRVYYNTKYFLN